MGLITNAYNLGTNWRIFAFFTDTVRSSGLRKPGPGEDRSCRILEKLSEGTAVVPDCADETLPKL